MLAGWRGLLPPDSRSPGAPRNQGWGGQSPGSAGACGDLLHPHAGKPGLGPSTAPGMGFRQTDPRRSRTRLCPVPAPASWRGSC